MNRIGRSLGRNRANSTLDNSGIRSLIGVVSEADGPTFFPSSAVDDGRLSHPGAGELGGLPRFGFNGPGQFTWDLGVIKKFPVTEALDLESQRFPRSRPLEMGPELDELRSRSLPGGLSR